MVLLSTCHISPWGNELQATMLKWNWERGLSSHIVYLHIFFSFAFLSPHLPLPFISAFFLQYQKKLFKKMHFYLGQEIGQFLHCKRDLLKHNKTVRIPESSSTLKHKYKGIGKLTSPKNFFSKFTFKNHRLFCLLWHLAVFQAGLSHHECPQVGS